MQVKTKIPVIDIKLLNVNKEKNWKMYLVYDKEKFKQFIENEDKRIMGFFTDKLPLEKEVMLKYDSESLVSKLEELEEKWYNLSIWINLLNEYTVSIVWERRSDSKPYYGILKLDITEDDLILKED